MIRKRLPTSDDAMIHRMVIEQLVPYSRLYDAGQSVTFAEIRSRLNRNKTYVAARGFRKPYGFITFVRKSNVLFVDMLAIDEREQGRGLGHELMKTAEDYGRKERCKSVELFVDDSNPRAIHFYTKRGYAVETYIPELYCYKMSKRITR
ncbi:GNAT family N-acetyltransferase [Paenibacillus oryzisoli]|uniref:GNAT family N-acetyltransferase n=1 Tax=Paenibacillus oryzisoli TaxID=1850517 RepID=UPI003D2BE7D3